MSRTGIVVQARLGSTRFPRKVLADLGGKPMLEREIERLKLVPNVDHIVVATTERPVDDPVEDLVSSMDNVGLWRGPEDDVLARFEGAASAFDLDVIGRVTGDCPLIDTTVIAQVLSKFRTTPNCDYASNCRPRSWPFGFDVEFVSRSALEAAAAEAEDPFDREHVLVYVFTRPSRFLCVNVESGLRDVTDLRLTVDYPEDLEFVRALFTRLVPQWPTFDLGQLLALLKDEPRLRELNATVPAHESVTDASQRGQVRRRAAN